MCLILFAYRVKPETPLIVAANRDEFYGRPARSAHFWSDFPELLAGRDLTAGGTWLGINRHGRFAAVTNFAVTGLAQPPQTNPENPSITVQQDATDKCPQRSMRSRGDLTSSFLRGNATAAAYARDLHGLDYQGFNLLLWDGKELVCTSNRGVTRTLDPGYYGLTNAELGVAWPKVVDGIARLGIVVNAGATDDALIRVLADDSVPPDVRLPHRGRPPAWERRVAPCFIRGEDYGTRASTAVIWSNGEVALTEQGYARGGMPLERVSFRIGMD